MQEKLENAISQINKKMKSHGITIGDSLILMSLEMARMELLHNKTISDNTLSGLKEIRSRTSRFYYLHDFPELFEIVQDALDMEVISNYNPNTLSYDIGVVGIDKEDWAAFFAKGIKDMFERFKVSAI